MRHLSILALSLSALGCGAIEYGDAAETSYVGARGEVFEEERVEHELVEEIIEEEIIEEEITVTTFYEELAPYGEWVSHPELGRVFVPHDETYRPYQNGHWVESEEGLVWLSYDAIGWAVCHYGSWAVLEDDTWAWVPGTEWAPAWVEWRHSDELVGWAPRLAMGAVAPEELWLFVEVSYLLVQSVFEYAIASSYVGQAYVDCVPFVSDGGWRAGPTRGWMQARGVPGLGRARVAARTMRGRALRPRRATGSPRVHARTPRPLVRAYGPGSRAPYGARPSAPRVRPRAFHSARRGIVMSPEVSRWEQPAPSPRGAYRARTPARSRVLHVPLPPGTRIGVAPPAPVRVQPSHRIDAPPMASPHGVHVTPRVALPAHGPRVDAPRAWPPTVQAPRAYAPVPSASGWAPSVRAPAPQVRTVPAPSGWGPSAPRRGATFPGGAAAAHARHAPTIRSPARVGSAAPSAPARAAPRRSFHGATARPAFAPPGAARVRAR